MKIFFHVLLDKVNLFPSIEILTSLVLEQTIETSLFRVSAAVITVYTFAVDGDIIIAQSCYNKKITSVVFQFNSQRNSPLEYIHFVKTLTI